MFFNPIYAIGFDEGEEYCVSWGYPDLVFVIRFCKKLIYKYLIVSVFLMLILGLKTSKPLMGKKSM
jgi:hypothetical protein